MAESDTRNLAPAASPPRDALVGRVLADRYEILSLVAKGGMGSVYRARQLALDRVVAVKTLDVAAEHRTAEFHARFTLEASIAARLTHPNTVKIHDFGRTDDGVCYIAMELIEGRVFQQVIKRESPLGALRALHIVRQVCGSLAEAHAQGIVHRDVKPGNMLLVRHGDDEDFVKLVDFGLVKRVDEDDDQITQAGAIMGSPLYMSPEQILGNELDARSDVYSLGVVMFYALTGKAPFERGNNTRLMASHLQAPVPRFAEIAPTLSLPASLEWVVHTCMAKAPAERFANATELARAIRACEAELRGDLAAPLALRLDADGRVITPTSSPDATASVSTFAHTPVAPRPRESTDPTLLRASGPSARGWTILFGATVLVLALGGAAVVGTGAALLATRFDRPAEIAPAALPEAPIARTHEVLLDTQPSGAEIERDGVLLGVAPLTVSVRDGERLSLRARLPSHEDREFVVDGSQQRVTVPLSRGKPSKRRAEAPKGPPPPASAVEAPAGGAAAPTVAAPAVTEPAAGRAEPPPGAPSAGVVEQPTAEGDKKIRDPWADP